MSVQEPKLFDSKMIFAVLLTGLVFVGWQNYMSKKYPEAYKKRAATEQTKDAKSADAALTTVNSETAPQSAGSITPKPTTDLQAPSLAKAPQIFKFESKQASFEVSSIGFGIQNYKIKTYKNSEGQPVQLNGISQYKLFEILYLEQKTFFDIKETSPGNYEGTAQIGDAEIRRTLSYDPDKYAFTSQIIVSRPSDQFYQAGLQIIVPDHIQEHKSSSWLFPSFQHQDFIVLEGDQNKRQIINVDKNTANIQQGFALGHLASIGSQYFSLALLDQSDVLPSVELFSNVADKTAFAKVTYKPASPKNDFRFGQILYAGPKSHDLLASVHGDLKGLIDFGFFGMIGEPLLFLMKWFYSLMGNWGFAIILLTLSVRILVLPLYLMSVKSMKAMQKIQPMMKAIQEKHKADPMTMNKEVMALMKEHKANPLGGCLPMLLQIPIFFALYQVIASSIELYQSPFLFWIQDLSQHDHFYVLPILMGAMMWFQQKITPTTMDPTQAKILAFMPIIFSVFMLALPSGLTLYMCVSSLFGIVQQLILVPKKQTT
jgi:YidC/Oxa1 family membrane protein insertase